MTTAESIRSRLNRGTIEAFVLHGMGLGLLFLMHVVLGRLVGTEGYGIFSYALAIAGILAIIAPLGWPTALMRFIAQYTEQQEWSLLKGAVRRAFQTTILAALVIALVLLVVSYWPGLPGELVTSLRFAALLVPFLSFVGLRRKALQGFQRVKSSIFTEEIALPLLVLGGVYLFAVTTASGALFVYVIAAFAVFTLGTALVWRSMPPETLSAKPEFETRSWMVVALPMVFGGLGQIIMNRTDMLMLGVMINMETVGLYTAANRIALLNAFVLTAVSTIAVPMIAAAYHAGRFADVSSMARRATLISVAGASPLFLTMLLAPNIWLGLFGAEFTEQGSRLLQVLAAGQFMNALTGPVGFALLMVGQERVFAWTTAVVALGNVVGNLLIIPVFGAVGAAAVTALSITVLCVWRYVVWRTRFVRTTRP